MTTTPVVDLLAEATLRATSPEGLLTAFAALTHRLDSRCDGRHVGHGSACRVTSPEVRAQRDAVKAEILRRIDGANPSPQVTELARLIEVHTGYDALNDGAGVFQISETVPCARCGTVTATALLIDDVDQADPVRLCTGCCAAW